MVTSPMEILHFSPLYDVLDHTNHIFSESLSSGDAIDGDEELQKDKYKDKDTQANTKCFHDQMYAIFLKSRGFNDIKYGISSQKNPQKIVGQTFSTNNSFGVGFDLVEA